MILKVDDPRMDYFIDINLSFFEETDKTEKPTSRKLNKARAEGQVAKSQEITLAVTLIVVFSVLRSFAGNIYTGTLSLFAYNLSMLSSDANMDDPRYVAAFVNFSFIRVVIMLLPIFIIVMIVGILTNLIQVKWRPTTKPLRPKLSKLNPLNGFKRIFSVSQLMELLKSLLKFTIIIMVVYGVISGEIEKISGLYELTLMQAVMYIGNIMVNLGVNVGIAYIFIAIADYMYNKYKHIKSLKMSKQEVKDEHKDIEGDPQIKGKIRQKMREISMRRMMQQLPKADVIITNPTHYAVALGYERDGSGAPVVLAKGVDYVAKRIRESAAKYDIAIIENRQLARTLYQVVEIGQEIPPELYQAVAEVLAYVYKLKNKVS